MSAAPTPSRGDAGEDRLSRAPAWAKLLVALGLVAAVVAVPLDAWPVFASVGTALAVLTGTLRAALGALLRRLLLLEPFVIGVAALALFQAGGGLTFLALLVRSTLCLWTMLLFAQTTPSADLLRLLRRLHAPALMVTTLALMVRYISVLSDESRRMRHARQARTFVRSRRRTWRALGGVIGQLFARSADRAERVYAAMCARGWK